MFGLPTLLRRGFLVPPEDAPQREKDTMLNSVTVEYILHMISDMIPEQSSNYIKNGSKTYGDKVIVLKSDTGSGKSTVLPAKLYTSFFQRTRRSIMVTQPRILNAVDIPGTIVPFNKELTLGKNIGYSTGSFKYLPKDKGVIFATVGILVQELTMNDDKDFMKKYQFIIIDEVHERDSQTDICLFLLKKFLKNNYADPFCPLVILMSATFDEKIFMNYFEVSKKNYIQVIGSTFPIEMFFPDYSVSDYIRYATLKAQQLHLENIEELDKEAIVDILIFVKDLGIGKKVYDAMNEFNATILGSQQAATEYEKTLKEDIDKLLKKGGASFEPKYILPILLDTTSFSKGKEDYKNLFSNMNIITMPIWESPVNVITPPKKYVNPARRVIISTNLAETGVTIPTLKYCIDTGYQLSSEFYPEYASNALLAKNIPYGSAIQRRGRVGRKAPGKFYPCYTEETFKSLPVDQIPTIINSDITEILLGILIREKDVSIVQERSVEKIKSNQSYDIFQMFTMFSNDWYKVENKNKTKIYGLDLIEMPSIQSLGYSVEKLYMLGFMDFNYDITATGYIASKFQFVTMEIRKFILSGYFYEANILDLITISAFIYISKRKVFTKKFNIEKFQELYGESLGIIDDFVIYLLIWSSLRDFIGVKLDSKTFLKFNDVKKWCEQSEIKFDGLMKVISIRDSIIENMLTIGLNPYYSEIEDMSFTSLLKTMPDIAISELCKIKKCAYEGWKANLFQHESGNNYKSVAKNILVKVKSVIVKPKSTITESKNSTSNQPQFIVANYALASKFGSAQYEFLADDFVCVLDGYVYPDLTFFLN